MFLKIWSTLILTIGILNTNLAQGPDLPNTTIRAFEKSSSSNTTLFVGLKGESFGSAYLYKSEDSGNTWIKMNDGKSLDPYAADIQAIAESKALGHLLFAGTWKNGLFKSQDGGKTWEKDHHFPSHDIRSIRTGNQNTSLIYAATSNFGVIKSTDNGRTWQRNAPASLDSTFQFAWHIELDPKDDNTIYAQTFGQGVWKSIDQGTSWQQSLDTKGKVCWDLAISQSGELWLASSMRGDSISSVYNSLDGGKSWTEMTDVPQIGINQIALSKEGDSQTMYIGSWRDGVYQYLNGSWTKIEKVDHSGIAHLIIQDGRLLVGSWGNGIYSVP